MSGSRPPSQNSYDNSSQSSDAPPYFPILGTWPNMSSPSSQFSPPPGYPQGFPNNVTQFSTSQGYPQSFSNNPFQFSAPQGYPPHFHPPHFHPSQMGTPTSETTYPLNLENINLSARSLFSDDDDHSTTKRRVQYTMEECTLLAQCWVNVSKDPVIGNDQKSDQMWERIAEMYNSNRPTNTQTRETGQLKAHYYKIAKQTKLFSACYNRISSAWGSGKNDADILEMAQTEYKQHHGTTGFKYINAWRILSREPKFNEVQGEVHASKRAKSNEAGGAHTSSSNVSEAATSRPIGQKAAKRKAKGKGKKDEMASALEIAKTHEDNASAYILFKEYEIIMKDTSGMTEMQLKMHEKVCEEILKKRGAQ